MKVIIKHKYKRYSGINLPSAIHDRNGRRSVSRIKTTSKQNDISRATSDQIGYETDGRKKSVKFNCRIDLTAAIAVTNKTKS